MYVHKLLVEVGTLEIENVAWFGFRLAQFYKEHPDVEFEWGEAYNENCDDDEYGDDDAHESAIFQIAFETKEGYNRYLAYRRQ